MTAGVVADFGVTAAIVAQYIGGTAFSTASVPTAATVDAIILRVSGQWSGLLQRRGADVAAVDLATGSQLYLMSQEWIAKRVAMDVLFSRERAVTPLAERWEAQTDAIKREVLEMTAALLDGQSSAAGAPGLIDSHVTRAEQVRTALRDQPLGQRLAWGSRV
jgi:hypothetical protein